MKSDRRESEAAGGVTPIMNALPRASASNPRAARGYRIASHRILTRCVVVGVATLFATLPGGTARAAETVLGVGLSAADPRPDGLDTGVELDIEIGKRAKVPLLAVTSELGLSYASFSDLQVYRGLVGGRLALGALIQPSIFAHIGIGRASFSDSVPRDSETSLTYDVGAALDLTLLPLVDVGVQVAYVSLPAPDPEIDWVRLGAHVTFAF